MQIVRNEPLILEKAYILGVLCGDGYLYHQYIPTKTTDGYWNHSVRLSAIDKDFVNSFASCMEKVYETECKVRLSKRRTSSGNSVYIMVKANKSIYYDLLNYGESGKKWKVPSIIINSENKEIKSMFLRGFFDSEGSVGKSNNQIRGFSLNKNGLSQISQLLIDLEIENKVFTHQREGRKTEYYITITHLENFKKFIKYVNFTIYRKKQRLLDYIEKDKIMKRCVECNNKFKPNKFNPHQKYCNPRCRGRVNQRKYYKNHREKEKAYQREHYKRNKK